MGRLKTKLIIVTGSSCSGKTTFVNKIRESIKLNDKIAIPRRYITRPKRLGDDNLENNHVNHIEFADLIKNGFINFYWPRNLKSKGSKPEMYGFNIEENKINILSANNDCFRFITRKSRQFRHLNNYEYVKFIHIHSDVETRAGRINKRSPDLSDEEVSIRISDDGMDVHGSADLVIKNVNKYDIRHLINYFENI